MGRKEITAGLSALVERHVSKPGGLWAAEVSIEPLGRCRPDYIEVTASGGKFATVAGIERACVSAYEIKSSMADYKSGNGLNAVGDENWIVCPYEVMMSINRAAVEGKIERSPLWGFAYPYPAEHGAKGPDIDRLPRYEGQVEGWKLHFIAASRFGGSPRQFPLSAILWSMMYAGARQGWRC